MTWQIVPLHPNLFLTIFHTHTMGESHVLDDWKQEQEEWLEALEEVLEGEGKGRTAELFQRLKYLLARHGVANGGPALNTPYLNTISSDDQPEYPGDLELEQKLKI